MWYAIPTCRPEKALRSRSNGWFCMHTNTNTDPTSLARPRARAMADRCLTGQYSSCDSAQLTMYMIGESTEMSKPAVRVHVRSNNTLWCRARCRKNDITTGNA